MINLSQANKLMANGEYMKTIKLLQKVNHPIAKYFYSICCFHLGRLGEGMKYYGNRWHMEDGARFKQDLLQRNPNWIDRIDQLDNKRVLITGEQGLGDELLFSQVIPFIASKAIITLVASEVNYSFLKYNLEPHGIKVINLMETMAIAATPLLKAYDVWTAIGDMYASYTVSNGQPPQYLYNAKNPLDTFHDHIAFVHSAGSIGDNSVARSIDPAIVAPAFADDKVVSFQIPVKDLSWAVSAGDSIGSMMDTANLLASTRCSVTCDTSFTHISLLTGKPTAILYKKYIDWRWKNELYPKVTLIKHSDIKGIKEFIKNEG